MSYPATVFRVMIASPGDVNEERKLAREIIFRWNSIHSEDKQMVLLPLGWEYDSYPLMGDHPQGILNKELLEKADILVGIFYAKLGTPTKEYDSGSVEEIERHIESGKPVMLYFSEADIKRGFDQDQLNKLEEFKKSSQDQGLYHSFKDIDDFKEKFSSHLQMLVNNEDYFEDERKLTDIGELNLSNIFGSTEEDKLREEAVTLLKESIENGEGHFTKHDDLSGWLTIQVRDKNLVETRDQREVAKWKKAIEELELQDMIEDVKYNGYRYNILETGYEYYEQLGK